MHYNDDFNPIFRYTDSNVKISLETKEQPQLSFFSTVAGAILYAEKTFSRALGGLGFEYTLNSWS